MRTERHMKKCSELDLLLKKHMSLLDTNSFPLIRRHINVLALCLVEHNGYFFVKSATTVLVGLTFQDDTSVNYVPLH